ncbi:MAG: thioredoxin [Methanomassiliicoccales archaeon]
MDDEIERIKRKKMEEMMQESGGNGWPGEPVELGSSNFDEFVQRYDLVVVDCWAPWCGPCKMISPVIDELSQELQGRVAFGKLNTDENQDIARRYSIYAIPTLLVFKNGQQVDNLVGAYPKEQIREQLSKHM